MGEYRQVSNAAESRWRDGTFHSTGVPADLASAFFQDKARRKCLSGGERCKMPKRNIFHFLR